MKDDFDALVEQIIQASHIGSKSDVAQEIATYADEVAEKLSNCKDVLSYAKLQRRPSMLHLYIDMLRGRLLDASVSLERFRDKVGTVL